MSGYRVLSERDIEQSSNHDEAFALDILLGLSGQRKSIPSKYFYDDRGSELFQQITELDEYYPTQCEFDILRSHGDAIAAAIDSGPFNLIELGAGDGRKTKVLIRSLLEAGREFEYVPIDISEGAMEGLSRSIAQEFSGLAFRGIVSDYYNALRWLNRNRSKPNLILFLGSNIGNFAPAQCRVFLRTLWNAMSSGDTLLVGFDLKKEIDVLLRAYNDSHGVTAAFNLNVLTRINRELGGDFDLNRFEHFGTYDVFSGAMESYLLSLAHQKVYIEALDRSFAFAAYEPIHLEYSYKFLPEEVEQLGYETGFESVAGYYDSRHWFSNVLWRARKPGPKGPALP